MTIFAYSFCMALLHSLWQSALLYLIYAGLVKIAGTTITPASRKHLLLITILAQAGISLLTFFIYYAGPGNAAETGFFSEMISRYLPAEKISPFTLVLFIAYFAILLVRLFKTVNNWYAFKKAYHTGLLKPSVDLKVFTLLKSAEFGIKKKVSLYFSNNIHTPLTFGFLKPVILLPVALVNQLSTSQAESLIIHELSHIRANDYLANWLVLFIEHIFFFNPFIISLCNRIRLEREKQCDSTVLHFKYPLTAYAESLVAAEKLKQALPVFQLAAVSSNQQLLKRIEYLLQHKEEQNRKNARMLPVLTLITLLCAMAYFMPLIRTATNKQPAYASSTIIPINQLYSPVEQTSFIRNKALITETAINDKQLVPQKTAVKTALKSGTKPAKAYETAVTETTSPSLTPVSYTDKVPTRQIIVEEQNSGSSTTTLKVYTLSYIGGKWVLQPGWTAISTIQPGQLMPDTIAGSAISKLVINREQ